MMHSSRVTSGPGNLIPALGQIFKEFCQKYPDGVQRTIKGDDGKTVRLVLFFKIESPEGVREAILMLSEHSADPQVRREKKNEFIAEVGDMEAMHGLVDYLDHEWKWVESGLENRSLDLFAYHSEYDEAVFSDDEESKKLNLALKGYGAERYEPILRIHVTGPNKDVTKFWKREQAFESAVREIVEAFQQFRRDTIPRKCA